MSSSNAETLPPVLSLGTPAKEWANDIHDLLGQENTRKEPTNPPIHHETKPSTATSSTMPVVPVTVPEPAVHDQQAMPPETTHPTSSSTTAQAESPFVKLISEHESESPMSGRDKRTVIQPEHTALDPASSQSPGMAEAAVEQPKMSRGESKASTTSTAYDIPGGWAKEWPASDAEQTHKDITEVLGSTKKEGQESSSNITPLAANDASESTRATPSHASKASGDMSQFVQAAFGGVQQTVGNVVGSFRSRMGQSLTEERPVTHVAGLLPPPEDSSTPDVSDKAATDVPSNPAPSGLRTGGAMINTSPPSGEIHPSTSDHNMYQVTAKQSAPSGPSPVDGLMPGQTRANLDTIHAGNYAYTELPNSDGNKLDPHTDGKGILDRAKEAVSGWTNTVTPATSTGDEPRGGGYIQQAMVAVGFGAPDATTVAEKESESEEAELAPTSTESAPGTAQPTSFSPKENILAHSGVKTSSHGPDDDVQDALSKSLGRKNTHEQEESGQGGDVVAFNQAAAKERDFATEAASSPSRDPVGTKAKESGIAVSDASRVNENSPLNVGYEDHTAAVKEDTPVKTTSNVHDKAEVATSPATNIEETSTKPKATVTTNAADKTPAEHYRDATTATNSSATSSSAPSSPVSKGHKRGPSLKDKIKGEMKVITGRLSRNDAKVEEGKALRSGGGITSPTSAK